jgi:sirohydrochlorin cobaltochelatase
MGSVLREVGGVVNDPQRLLNATLVLIGHGSSKNAESRRSVEKHAAALRRRGLFGRVWECFYREKPFVREIWDRAPAGEVFAIPVFMSEGYFTQEVLPRELGLKKGNACSVRMSQDGRRVLRYGRPVGTHPSMTGVVLARAEEVLKSFPAGAPPRMDETALVIAGHGTLKNDQSREVIDRQVEIIRGLGIYAEVHPAFMEEDPRIGGCYGFVLAPNLVMVPFFVGDGMHVLEDIPVLLGENKLEVRRRLECGEAVWHNPTSRHGKRVWYTGSVGLEPLLADVILERVQELAADQVPWGILRRLRTSGIGEGIGGALG